MGPHTRTPARALSTGQRISENLRESQRVSENLSSAGRWPASSALNKQTMNHSDPESFILGAANEPHQIGSVVSF